MDCSQSGNGNLGCIGVKADRENWFDKYSSVIANARIVYIYKGNCNCRENIYSWFVSTSLSSLDNKGCWILSWLNTYESCIFFCRVVFIHAVSREEWWQVVNFESCCRYIIFMGYAVVHVEKIVYVSRHPR